VFVGRDGVDWMVEHLGLTDRDQCCVLLQEMCDLELIVPWQTEKKEKKSGVKFEDSDRFFWFDYAAIIRQKAAPDSARGGAASSGAPAAPAAAAQPPSSADDREMHKVGKGGKKMWLGVSLIFLFKGSCECAARQACQSWSA